MNKVFGIDLGTTYSCVAYIDENGKPVVLNNSDESHTTPSVVFYEDKNSALVGAPAKEAAEMYPEKVVSFAKNFMGKSDYTWTIDGITYRPEDVSARVLLKVVNDAVQTLRNEGKLGQDDTVTDVVITCPAYFGTAEREATKSAGEIAGLNVLDIINEPTAAAITYGLIGDDKTVLVYDLGGGTFDITVIRVSSGNIEVVCTGGNHNLGGKLWDNKLIDALAAKWSAEKGDDDILDDEETAATLRNIAESTKKLLTSKYDSKKPEEDKAVPANITHQGGKLRVSVTRAEFDEITSDLLTQTIDITKEVLGEAAKKGVTVKDISEILLVGGSCKMPQIMTRVKSEFPGIDVKLFDPDESVAKGAAIYAVNRLEMKNRIQEIIETKKISEKEAKELYEVEAEKVSSKGGKLVGGSIKITNVSSRSFGIIAYSGNERRLFNIIMKNDALPANATDEFCTRNANQDSVELEVFESLSSEKDIDPSYGTPIGTASLELPPNLPANAPLEVTFTLNESGLLELTAEELTKHRKCTASFDVKGSMSDAEIEKSRELLRKSSVE